MKSTLVNILTKNIVLLLGALLSCMTGFFLWGALIGAGAALMHCVFGGLTLQKDIRATVKTAMPIAIMNGVVCAIGAQFSGPEWMSATGIIATIVIMIICVFLGNFMQSSKFYEEAENNIQNTNNEQTTAPSTPAAHTPTVNIPVSPEQESGQRYQSTMAKWNARAGITENRALPNAIPLPETPIQPIVPNRPKHTQEELPNEEPNFPHIIAGMDKLSPQVTIQADAKVAAFVQQTTGLTHVDEKAKQLAYDLLPAATKKALPKDPATALLWHVMGKRLSFMETIPEELWREIPEYVFKSLVPYNTNYTADDWLITNSQEALAQFDQSLPVPLKYIPTRALYDLLLPQQRLGVSQKEMVATATEYLLDIFRADLPEPLRRIPLFTLYAALDAKKRAHPDYPYKDVFMYRDDLMEKFDLSDTTDMGETENKHLYIMLPKHLRKHSERELFTRFENAVPKERREMVAPVINILKNIELLANMYYEDTKSTDTTTTVSMDNTLNENFFINRAPFNMLRYMIEYSTDIEEENIDDETFVTKYMQAYFDEVLDKNLPFPLNYIPLPMFEYLVKNKEILNHVTRSMPAQLHFVVEDNPTMFRSLFVTHEAKTDRRHWNVIPSDIYSVEGAVPYLNDNQRYPEAEDAQEIWRLWIPPKYWKTPVGELFAKQPQTENDPVYWFILNYATALT